ncbi:MAG TPA: undecaprenyldiphospho-muramoylpentapeptide beta-N-acetylglucosaminyltransferase [Cellvibrionaceae bacterium]
MSRILIMAGGTGGHVFPALAVAHKLQANGHDVYWLGTQRGIEARVVPAAGIAINYLSIEGVRGRGILGLLKAPFLIMCALWQSMAAIKKFNADVVVGFGGFVSGPGGLATWLLRKPLVIHEQNAVVGTTNRLLAPLSRYIATGFDNVLKNGDWLGNPVRDAIALVPAPELRMRDRDAEPVRILVLGGSLGAQAINQLLPEALSEVSANTAVTVWHQSGARHTESTLALYMLHQVNAKVEPFIEDMAGAYAWADLVICRAGALTVSEIMAVGVAALLIPLPHAIDDHQTCNAAVLASAGAALSIPQRDLDARRLAHLLQGELSDRERLLQMAMAARRLHKSEAALRMVEIIEDITNG